LERSWAITGDRPLEHIFSDQCRRPWQGSGISTLALWTCIDRAGLLLGTVGDVSNGTPVDEILWTYRSSASLTGVGMDAAITAQLSISMSSQLVLPRRWRSPVCRRLLG
jgi:hypothetical protein